ncbi:hypothetical protein B0H17DRAFT_189084 [Mycena rosella]|uniref:Uncharacterized protein n=1 Tax=Mycena rosella TaxID=1033263 RepID=A0AAD7DY07_MYCRO|nr:hypothetical protein B0H17DRAFT_189084 [Mycena rosella]
MDCTITLGANRDWDSSVGSFQTNHQISPIWRKVCFHRHLKCAQHANSCARGKCAANAVPANRAIISVGARHTQGARNEPSIKQEVKMESSPGVKHEAPLQLASAGPVPPSYTPVPETEESTSDVPRVHVSTRAVSSHARMRPLSLRAPT